MLSTLERGAEAGGRRYWLNTPRNMGIKKLDPTKFAPLFRVPPLSRVFESITPAKLRGVGND
jgi:hypothetical protein